MPNADRIAAVFLFCLGASSGFADDAAGDGAARIIGEVRINNADVFDLSDPEENTWLYRWINRLHIKTRRATLYDQLLFRPGEPFDKRAVEESERILRRNEYLYDANIEAIPNDAGTIDLDVNTRDVWSLMPEISLSHNNGRTNSRIGIEESNLLGRGQLLEILRDKDIDRDENIVRFADQHLGHSWVSLAATYSDNSDGYAHRLSLMRPFYSLDTRWSAGGQVMADDKLSRLYQFGEPAAEFRHKREFLHLFGGRSGGLRNGRARRWTAGMVFDNNRFSAAEASTLPSVEPNDRKLVYPYVGFELVEDGFVTASNHDQIDRTEDFQMGLQLRASLGWAATALGADRNAAVFTASASRGLGSLETNALIVAAWTRGRLESGELANATLSFSARHYRRQSAKRTFYVGLTGTAGDALDLDNPVELGSDEGLRGYPTRYQVGESMVLATVEQRYFTDWDLWRLARVGAAVFADVGRVWGPNPLGADNRGWLVDIGFGLRLSLTRFATGRVIHIDLAFPLNGDSTIDDVQILLESRRSF